MKAGACGAFDGLVSARGTWGVLAKGPAPEGASACLVKPNFLADVVGSSFSSARGALGAAAGGGLTSWALGAAGGNLGAMGAVGGGSDLSSFAPLIVGCVLVIGAVLVGLGSTVDFAPVLGVAACEAVVAAVGANDKVKAGTGGACVGGDEPREPYRSAVVSARPLR